MTAISPRIWKNMRFAPAAGFRGKRPETEQWMNRTNAITDITAMNTGQDMIIATTTNTITTMNIITITNTAIAAILTSMPCRGGARKGFPICCKSSI